MTVFHSKLPGHLWHIPLTLLLLQQYKPNKKTHVNTCTQLFPIGMKFWISSIFQNASTDAGFFVTWARLYKNPPFHQYVFLDSSYPVWSHPSYLNRIEVVEYWKNNRNFSLNLILDFNYLYVDSNSIASIYTI